MRQMRGRQNAQSPDETLAESAGTTRTGTVSGIVSGPHAGDLSLTVVFLYNASHHAVTKPALPIVASGGTYTIHGVPAGKWMAFCQPAARTPLTGQTYKGETGFDPSGTPITVRAGGTVTGIDFHLARAGLLKVTVTDSTGKAIAGASILSYFVDRNRLTSGTRPPPKTDAKGSANLANVPLQSKLAVITRTGKGYWWDGATSKKASKTLVIPAQGHVLAVAVTLPAGA